VTASDRWVCLDVGETLIDETRVWSTWADVLGIPRMTFLAAFGAAVARGQEHLAVFAILGVADWRSWVPEVRRRYGGFQSVDLYPDALPSIAAMRDAGLRVSVIGNQPTERGPELRALGVDTEVLAMSEEMGVAKPAGAFFVRALRLMGDPEPAQVAYVGDRPDNDVAPAAAAGMRAVWLRRGPWGFIRAEAPGASLRVGSLTELVERLDELWPPDPAAGRASVPLA
jgi:FMN phosphatase YigB (HAD superfamily)